MKHLKSFENKNYQDLKQYDNKFKFKIDDPIVFLKNELHGTEVPNLTNNIYFIQSRDNENTTNNYYLLYDIHDITFNWVLEKDIRPATEEELAMLKYNI